MKNDDIFATIFALTLVDNFKQDRFMADKWAKKSKITY